MAETEVDTNSTPYTLNNVYLKDSKTDSRKVFDDDWVKSTFIITDKELSVGNNKYEDFIRNNRYSTSASHKFSSTTPGMSLGVNPKPQFTRYCDIRDKGRFKDRPDITPSTGTYSTGLGMGGYYSEAIDDNEQRVYFRFGVPSYLWLPFWLAKAFDIDKAILQGRGTITSTFLEAVGVFANYYAMATSPVMYIASKIIGVIGSSARFYSLKPNMYAYWSTVENILNSLVARRTLLPHIFKDYTYKLSGTVGTEEKISQEFLNSLNALIPDIVNEYGHISVYAIALRAQAAYNRVKIAELKATNDKTVDSITANDDIGVTSNLDLNPTYSGKATPLSAALFKLAYEKIMNGNPDENVGSAEKGNTTPGSTVAYNYEQTDQDGNPLDISLDPNDPQDKNVDKKVYDNINKKADRFNKFSEYLLAEMTEGAAFAVFNVNATGSVGESFSSNLGGNPIEATFNAISAKARNVTSMLSSLSGIPVIGDALSLAADATAKVISVGSYGMANPLLALAYGVNVTMPKVWESSSSRLPSSSYKIRLISPYNNAYSQLFNLYMPLSMVLAASLPRSTGTSSYVSPFFCETFDKGRNNIQLGMIRNCNVTRGTSNMAFSRAGHPNAIDIDMEVESLDEVASVEVSSNGVITRFANAIPEAIVADTPFIGYMNTVAAVDVYVLAFRIPKFRLKAAQAYMTIKTIADVDPATFAAGTVSSAGLGPLGMIIGDPASALMGLNTY